MSNNVPASANQADPPSSKRQYTEYSRPAVLPASSLEHPWVLVRSDSGRRASGRIAYLTHKQNDIRIGIALLLSKDHWKPKGKYPQYCFVFDADVLHVFPCEPDQKSIQAARRETREYHGAFAKGKSLRLRVP